ncbi:MAG: DUF3164 family protein [Eubacterium sp.]|nr:DUF3164 family protein [Eubacterium sp.]
MTAVEMTAEEKAQFEAFKREQERKQNMQERKDNREAYSQLVDEQIETAIPELQSLSEQIATVKRTVFGNFKEVLRMKEEVMHMSRKGGQFSHTFTNSTSTMRLTLGANTIDSYRDTAEDGIAMVKEYITSLAKDDETQLLVDTILRLLSKDQQGNLKASRVLQLKQMAEQTGNERFIEGVQIIMEAYQPTTTKQYIRAEVKDADTGAWRAIPLSVTDAE